MDAASSAAFTEFINHSIARMNQQQESFSSTGSAVQALVTQIVVGVPCSVPLCPRVCLRLELVLRVFVLDYCFIVGFFTSALTPTDFTTIISLRPTEVPVSPLSCCLLAQQQDIYNTLLHSLTVFHLPLPAGLNAAMNLSAVLLFLIARVCAESLEGPTENSTQKLQWSTLRYTNLFSSLKVLMIEAMVKELIDQPPS
ncbi:hypothetical protein DPX16_17328 [Anabarilius grahami]|uniref:Uncharacterized protein n=1 Tax=Anabarilius grahami TaxID=495550 RepID=A0A3N0XYS5_ANAGA|nr:hypothetical protein DPX16_17328 [Anabarilius grahami]